MAMTIFSKSLLPYRPLVTTRRRDAVSQTAAAGSSGGRNFYQRQGGTLLTDEPARGTGRD
jgi:hypothetical protein